MDARRAYYLFEGGTALLHALAFTLMLVCQVQVVGLTPFQLVIMGTAMGVTLLLFEIPTGAVADLYSRRRSVLIGTAIIAVSFLLQGGWPSLWPTLAGQVIWGLGYTFVSGAAQAWITDEIGEDHLQPVFTRATQVVLACTVAGTVLAGLIGQMDLRLRARLTGPSRRSIGSVDALGHAVDQAGRVAQHRPLFVISDVLGSQCQVPGHFGRDVVRGEVEVRSGLAGGFVQPLQQHPHRQFGATIDRAELRVAERSDGLVQQRSPERAFDVVDVPGQVERHLVDQAAVAVRPGGGWWTGAARVGDQAERQPAGGAQHPIAEPGVGQRGGAQCDRPRGGGAGVGHMYVQMQPRRGVAGALHAQVVVAARGHQRAELEVVTTQR